MGLITISNEQRAYRDAYLLHDELLQQVAPLINELLDSADFYTDEGIEAYVEAEAQIHARIGDTQAWLALQEAENALLDWGLANLKTQVRFIEEIELEFRSKMLSIRKKTIELFMMLDDLEQELQVGYGEDSLLRNSNMAELNLTN